MSRPQKGCIFLSIIIFIFLFFFLKPSFSNYSAEQNEPRFFVNTFKFPSIYVKLASNKQENSVLKVKADKKEVTEYSYSVITNNKNKQLIPILLIQNSKDISEKAYDISIMNLLLQIKGDLPWRENTMAFTFSSELERVRGSILTINFTNNPSNRLIDSLILVTNLLNNVEGYPFIIIIGTGKDSGSITKKFLPKCPIVFIDVENNLGTKREIGQIANLSSGFSVNLLDITNYSQVEKKLKKNLKIESSILLFKVPFHFSLLKRHSISLKFSNGEEYLLTYNVSGFPIIFPRILIISLLVLASYCTAYIVKRKLNRLSKSSRKTYLGWLEVHLKNGKKRIDIDNKEFIIGSKLSCNFQIDDFEISALHCIIKEKRNGFEIVDLNSRKGTYVNSIRVSNKLLDDKDIIRIGSTTMIFRESKASE